MNPRGVVPSAPRLHMILRRGSPYGPVIRDRYTPDNVDRGLLFVCYSSSIAQVSSLPLLPLSLSSSLFL